MGAFEYLALDPGGRKRKGVLEGDTARQIRQQLREQGLTPLSVDAVLQKEAKIRRSGFGRGVGGGELAMMTRQLSTLVGSGVVLEEALRAVSQQTEKPRLKRILLAARSRIMEGHTLADSLGEFPDVFPHLYRATVAAGEQTGNLDKVLDRLADYTESRQALNQKIGLALFYPALLSVVALIVVVALLAYVVPQVVQVFDSIGQDLPLLTRMLIAISDFLVEHGLALFAALLLAVAGFRLMMRHEGLRAAFQRFLLRLPVVSRLVLGLDTVRFTRTLSITLAAGVPILDALAISADVVTIIPIRRTVQEAAARVREGENLHEALARDGRFSPITIHLIASGESSGNLESMLERAARNQERELETLIGMFLGLFEPLLILFMGGLVLTIVIAILLPVFELNQLVR